MIMFLVGLACGWYIRSQIHRVHIQIDDDRIVDFEKFKNNKTTMDFFTSERSVMR